MRERFVGLRHLVDFVALADGVSLALVGVQDFGSEGFLHGDAFAGIGKIHEPPERQRELAFEGHAAFDYWRTGTDMVRTQCGTGLEVSAPCTIAANSHLTVHPIPQREMDVNQNMEQNDGY